MRSGRSGRPGRVVRIVQFVPIVTILADLRPESNASVKWLFPLSDAMPAEISRLVRAPEAPETTSELA
jgi:hypothetical protein